MYRLEEKGQLGFEDFYIPFGGHLDGDNRWVKLAELIPWEEFEADYAAKFKINGMGSPAKTFRMALGSQIIKKRLKTTDDEVVEQIKENMYMQYFIGFEGFRKEAPFDSSMMSLFRERLTDAMIERINEKVIEAQNKLDEEEEKAKKDKKAAKEADGGKDGGKGNTNQGQLLIDATCTPQDIRYPNDLSLLNEAREKTEKTIDRLYKEGGLGWAKKPRTYRRKARKAYMVIAKTRQKSAKLVRRGLRQQLGYVSRNLQTIGKMVESGAKLSVLTKKEYRDLLVIQELFRQQQWMYKNRTHSVGDRIVSIAQPHVRPIVRGKAGADVEFGSKMTFSVVNGFVRIEKLSWDNYNESVSMIDQIKAYKKRYGYYPESVHVDKIYQTRTNRKFCKLKHIRMSGPKLGRPVMDKIKSKMEKTQEKLDANARQPVEGKFGNVKRKYGLNRVYSKLAATSECEIYTAVLVLNLETAMRKARRALIIFFALYFAQIWDRKAAVFRAALVLYCINVWLLRKRLPVSARNRNFG